MSAHLPGHDNAGPRAAKRLRVPGSIRASSLLLVAGILILVISAALAALRSAHAFFAITSPTDTQVLVIEGWIPDYALEDAVAEYRRGGYRWILATGGITADGWKDEPKYTAADWAFSRLKRRGIIDGVFAVPCREEKRDRTYHSALALKEWMDHHAPGEKSVNIITLGTHARRTRLLFEKALGPGIRVGIIAIPEREFDPEHWWRSSDGCRNIVGELIAYLYSRLFFWP